MRKREDSCEYFLLDWINHNSGWHKKVDLYKIGEDWSPETCGRKLRKLSGKGIDKKTGQPFPKLIDVSYYNGRKANGLAMYSRLGEAPKKFEPNIIEKPDGTRVLVLNE